MAKSGTINIFLVDQGTSNDYYWGEGTMYAVGTYLQEYLNKCCKHFSSTIKSADYSWFSSYGRLQEHDVIVHEKNVNISISANLLLISVNTLRVVLRLRLVSRFTVGHAHSGLVTPRSSTTVKRETRRSRKTTRSVLTDISKRFALMEILTFFSWIKGRVMIITGAREPCTRSVHTCKNI